ncbi:oxidative stress survival, Svf1-like protein [Bisporella sp. PMI_857]|nr:oxidative stress survival, Svf1-like protein [Bisporella sp. PMI_857]
MFNWVRQQAANVAGTAEPIYGPSAIHTVTKQAEKTPYTELKKEDTVWQALGTTNVETQTFYFFADSGHLGSAQVIYSNVMGVHTTVQFNTKIWYPRSENKPNLWSSDPLSGVDFSEDKLNFYADDVAIELSEDGTTFTIKSMVNAKSLVNITFTRTAPGFVVGENGTTNYGTDPNAPWAQMRHAFWPRNTVEGQIVTEEGPVDFKGRGMLSHAIQLGKPHHLAAKWNFFNFQGPTFSAVMMEFTTPASYDTTLVNVGGIVKDGEIITANANGTVEHTKKLDDPDNDWPAPEAIKAVWTGKAKDGKEVTAILEGPLDERIDRVDVMAEVPGFVKSIVAAAAGTRPYIYQYSPHDNPISLKIKIGDEETTEQGVLFSEATFISA